MDEFHKLAPLPASQQCPLVESDPAPAGGADTGKSPGTLGKLDCGLVLCLCLSKVVGT